MLTTLLIVVPLATALVVWILPLSRETTGGLALMAVLAEVGLWVGAARNFDFASDTQQFSTNREWFSELGISYAVGLYGFQYWLVGLTVVVGAAAVLIAGGELLLPTEGAAGFLSRLAVFALYPVILWFGGAVNRPEREQVTAALRAEDWRERLARMRRERGTESDDQARAEELYEQDIRDRDRGNF